MLKKFGFGVVYFRTPQAIGRAHSVTARCTGTNTEIEFRIAYRKATFISTPTLIVTFERRNFPFLSFVGIADPGLGLIVEFYSCEVDSVVDIAKVRLRGKEISGFRDWQKIFFDSIGRSG